MRACIHRGTKEIGGTCVELESQGKRIVLDVGLPLDVADPEDFPLHPIKGFEAPDADLLGVVISHPHQDHYGLAHRLPKETPFLIGKAAEAILAAADVFSPAGLLLERVIHLEDRTPITLGPFTVTPILVDHSAYDAYAVLIEADGTALFYTGDLRAHGRKWKLFQKLLRLPPKHVDALLMEGTTIGRMDTDSGFQSEDELEDRFVELFKQTPGMPLVWCSGQNIDRIVTIYRACKKSGRQFIIDMYTAHILRAIGNERLPQAEWDGIKVFLPKSQKWQIMQRKEFELAASYKAFRIYPELLADEASRSVMLFRPSMMRDVEEAACVGGSRLICSVWGGYLKNEKNKPLLDWLHRHGIPLDDCHTSGHAAVKDLVKLRKAFADAPVVPIHSNQPDRFEELFGNAQRRADGEWWEVEQMNHIRPQQGESAAEMLGRIVGRNLLLNVTVDGKRTSVCVNIESSGSASWRKKEENKNRPLKLDFPPFALTDHTLVLCCKYVNALANNFHVIREAIPPKALSNRGNVAIGSVPGDGTDMGCLLGQLEQQSDEILEIENALNRSLDTKLRLLHRSLDRRVRLMDGNELSEYGKSVLSAFSESQQAYAALPMLRGFGTENPERSQACPSKKDGRLRYYMWHNKSDPLATSRPLDYIAYELKPLNISDKLNWNCSRNPRTDSVDLLMSLNGSPVFTEVKMAGDKFVSAAAVQLLYYASILANEKQTGRLGREFKFFTSKDCWLCIIAEERDETKSKERGFSDDLKETLSFLGHEETKKAFGAFFGGIAVVVIKEGPQPFCTARAIPSFRVVTHRECFIDWKGEPS